MAEEQQQREEANTAPTANGTSAKKSKAEKLKEKKARQKANKQQRRQQQQTKGPDSKANGTSSVAASDDDDIIIEYVSAPLELESFSERETSAEPDDSDAPAGLGFGGLGFGGGLGFTKAKEEATPAEAYQDFKRIFEKFASAERVMGAEQDTKDEDDVQAASDARAKEDKKATTSKAEPEDEVDEGVRQKLSKKQQRLLSRMKIADLKKVCERPEVVEVWDVTAPDPPLLVFLKATRNTVPVPRHWSQKRKYLQGKRGLDKPPFKLPDFIEATGITQMRNAYDEKEKDKKMKAKLRDRMAPKMGKMDIDYQVLHDAFFKHQKKPPLTKIGELYYEGKEFEARVAPPRPGFLSDALREALGMTPTSPPPWLINMQRYGPPPSYPNLKIPGLNAPIPSGCQFGYHAGGWGKPPVDEEGNPLYGDVFAQQVDVVDSDDEVDKASTWGELDELESEEESEEEEEEEEDKSEEPDDASIQDGIASGLASGLVSGMASGIASSLPSGIDTPDTINLRKQQEEGPRQLYQVLEQRQVGVGANTIMGSDHVYVVPGAEKKGDKKRPDFLKHLGADVEVTISPEELEGLDEDQIKALYDARMAEMRAGDKREDFSDLVAANAAQQKRKIAQKAEAKAKKTKTDNFKF